MEISFISIDSKMRSVSRATFATDSRQISTFISCNFQCLIIGNEISTTINRIVKIEENFYYLLFRIYLSFYENSWS